MSARLIDSYLNGVEVRRTVRNWPEDVRAIVDGYRAYTSVSHAVQKDAIQNSWSARRNNRGRGWGFSFELLETRDRQYLIMTDEGTTGLTGRVLTPEEYEMDLPGQERWGRFEAVAFTQPRAERTLGSRGRGKFIFVGASKEHTILYDSLRDDGSYRFGFRTVIRTESPVAAYDGQHGIGRLREMTQNSVEPLVSVGTRVIIVSPTDELMKDLRNGRFLSHIGETWWEIILKYGASIKVKADQQEHTATIPEEFDLRDDDSREFKVWSKTNQRIPASFREVRVKNLRLVYKTDKPVLEDVRGVAIQRDGMKICAVQPAYIGREIAQRIYGYINFDADTEEALLEDEGIEHYSYDYRRSLPGAIKRFVEDEMMRFAQEKLGYGTDAREVRRQQQRNAERRALTAANAFARALGIGLGPVRPHGGPGGERVAKKVRVQMEELSLPRPMDLRVNYGEDIDNVEIRAVNDDERDIDLRVKLFLRYYDRVVKTFVENDFKLKAHTTSEAFGPFRETLTEADYPDRGKYTIAAKIYSLMDEDKGAELDNKTKSFYLEDEPPMGGLFERCEAFGFPDEDPMKFWMGYSEYGSERGLVLYYNLSHPGYAAVSENEEDLAEYILRIAGQEICGYDLMQETPILFREEDRNDPKEVLKGERKVVGEIIYKFRRGEV